MDEVERALSALESAAYNAVRAGATPTEMLTRYESGVMQALDAEARLGRVQDRIRQYEQEDNARGQAA